MNKKSIFIAAMGTAVALFTASCGSDDAAGTSPSATSTVGAPASTAEMTESSMAQTSAEGGDTSSAPMEETSSSMDTAMSSMPETSSMTEMSSMPEMSSGAENTAATTTVGNDSGELDEASVAWFDTFCTGLKPLTDLSSMGADMGGTSGSPDMTKAGEQVSAAGTALSDTAGKLADLPAPGFEGGADFATKSVAGLKELGSVFTEAGKKIAAGDQSGLSDMAGQMNSDALTELGKIDATDATKAAIAKIPSCQSMGMGG